MVKQNRDSIEVEQKKNRLIPQKLNINETRSINVEKDVMKIGRYYSVKYT